MKNRTYSRQAGSCANRKDRKPLGKFRNEFGTRWFRIDAPLGTFNSAPVLSSGVTVTRRANNVSTDDSLDDIVLDDIVASAKKSPRPLSKPRHVIHVSPSLFSEDDDNASFSPVFRHGIGQAKVASKDDRFDK